MNRDSVIFYLSFYEAIRELPESEKLKAYEMIFDYAFSGKEPEERGIASAVFKLIKPQIDANNKRYENGVKGGEYGKLGGRPKTPKKPQENPKETPKKPQANAEETPNVNDNDNVNVNVNDNVNANDNANANANAKEKDCKESSDELSHTDDPKHRHGEYKKVLLTDDELSKLYADFGKERTDQAIEFLDSYIVEKSYKSKSHYLAIRRWVINAVDEQAAKKAKQGNTKTVGNESAYQRDREWAEEMQAMQERGELNGF